MLNVIYCALCVLGLVVMILFGLLAFMGVLYTLAEIREILKKWRE